MTCCKWSSGSYGCCPLALAECCADGLHCCPNGTKCNDKEGTCDQLKSYDKQSKLKIMSQMDVTSDELCPDKNQTCLESETCCKEKSGSYGCCPYKLGICCSDLLHCCPHGTRCDLKHKECIRTDSDQMNDILDTNHLTMTMRLIGFEAKRVKDVVCPGGKSDCPDGNTCCKISEDDWGCCPLLNAVCCDDKIHCCPNGTRCTPSACQPL